MALAGRRRVLEKSRLDRLERALALRRLYGRASSLRDVLPGVALVIGGRSARAGGAGAGCAVIVALHGDAKASFHSGLWWLRPGDCRRGDHGKGGRERASDCGGGDGAS